MADELRSEFVHEASEHLATASQILLSLAQRETADPEEVNACFRALHTLKGLAGFLGFERIKRVAHAGEQVLDAVRSQSLRPTRATWEAVLGAVDRLERLVHTIAEQEQEPPGDDADVIDVLEEETRIKPVTASLTREAAISRRHARPMASAHSVDALIAALIAVGPADPSTIEAQLAAIDALAERERWPEAPRAALQAVNAVAQRLRSDPAAFSELLVALQALQAAVAEQSPAALVQPALGLDKPASPAQGKTADSTPSPMPSEGRAALEDFRSECQELLVEAERAVLGRTQLEREQVDAVFRAFHTIKGMAAYVGQPVIEQAAHAIEAQLLPVRDGERAADASVVQLVLAGVDRLRAILAGAAMPMAAEHGSAEESPRLGDILVEMGVPREVIEETARHLKPNERLGDKLVESGRVPRQLVEQAAQRQKALRSDAFSRVATTKLEDVVNMVGELLIAQAMVANDPELPRLPSLSAAVQRQSHILRRLQVLALSLRMVPLRATFQKMARAVHDTAKKLEKEVEFQTAGDDTEIDRSLAESMADPLLHMVRNAVDHGIEKPEERVRAGKPRAGKVRLAAYHAGDDVVIELSDDGRGMDPERLRRKALEKGLIAADRQLTEAECYDLIFLPGFSTAERVSEVSGRGVGMDVVRRQVQAANGRIEIRSRLGQGSVFILRLPLTTAILDALLVDVGSERFLVPLTSVVCLLRPQPAQVATVLGRGQVVLVRGRELPIVPLGERFAIAGWQRDPCASLLVVIEDRTRTYALQVDQVLGQRQVVIKPFEHGLAHHPGVSGSAILGDGRVALILDPAHLLDD
ncbi:MAG: chemotaxis protein CheA, partial [Planctomycetota bacterium]|nr:chemotaxis protein CheA [Planctomycetota bacterium]